MYNQRAGCRRNFLKRVSTAGTAGLIGMFGRPTGASAGSVLRRSPDVSLEDFSSKIGAEFQVQTSTGEFVTLHLKEANSLRSPPKAGYRRPFSLIFRAPAGARLPQDTYALRVPSRRPMKVLLVPVDMPRKHNHLEAIFG